MTEAGEGTHIDPVDRPKALYPHEPVPDNVVHEHVLPAEQRLPEALRLGLLPHVGRAGQERVPAHLPLPGGGPVDGQGDDVAEQRGAQRDPAVARVHGLGHVAAREQLPQAELDLAAQLHRGAHVDHGARLGLDGAARREVDRQHGVGVPVRDGVAAAGEGAVVADRHHAGA